MRRYESMSRDQIHLAIAQEREMLAAIEKYQAYLASGNGNPKDELSRLQLQLSNSRLAEKRTERLTQLGHELAYRDQNGID
jgi:hypothetical protein